MMSNIVWGNYIACISELLTRALFPKAKMFCILLEWMTVWIVQMPLLKDCYEYSATCCLIVSVVPPVECVCDCDMWYWRHLLVVFKLFVAPSVGTRVRRMFYVWTYKYGLYSAPYCLCVNITEFCVPFYMRHCSVLIVFENMNVMPPVVFCVNVSTVPPAVCMW